MVPDPVWLEPDNPAGRLRAECVPSLVYAPCENRSLFVLCIKTVGEHPMVLFIVVIVETFVHVQH
jgi:hypothetical protein